MGNNRPLLIAAIAVLAIGQTVALMDKVVCYYGTWATYRNGNGKVAIEDIDATLCDYIIYSFVGLQANGQIKLLDAWMDVNLQGFTRFNTLKTRNPKMKTILAIGGWNEGSLLYSQIASSASSRKVLIDSAVQYLKQYGFDGFDLDWEYPGQRGGNYATDKANFVNLIREMRQEFDKHGFILSAAVGVSSTTAAVSYDIPALTTYLDFVNLMMYDLHGSWDPYVGGNAPLYPASFEVTPTQLELNVDACINYWISNGANPAKLIMGIGFYGQSFTLANSANNKPNAPSAGPGNEGNYTKQRGFLGYNEICEKIKDDGWKSVLDPEQKFIYAYKGNQWVGYDDPASIALKVNYAKSRGLGGAMVWSIETDDTKGACGEKWPLLKAIRNAMAAGQGTVAPSTAAPTTSAPAATTVTTKAPTTVPSGSTTSTTTTTTQATTTVAQGGDYPNSLCTAEKYIRDPSDCAIFYSCRLISGSYKATKMSCSGGLVFNEAIIACDYKANVPACQ